MNTPIKRRKTNITLDSTFYNKNLKKSNLGMKLENLINNSNTYYLENDLAVIHKKPTPIQVVRVDYPARNKAVIREAYYKTPSTTDYNGIYRGKYIDFEAKETNSNTLLPLANIHPHQIKHLYNIVRHGGIGFFIVSFKVKKEIYLAPFADLYKNYYLIQKRKSVPYSYFKEKCFLIKEGYNPLLDYLDVLDKLYF